MSDKLNQQIQELTDAINEADRRRSKAVTEIGELVREREQLESKLSKGRDRQAGQRAIVTALAQKTADDRKAKEDATAAQKTAAQNAADAVKFREAEAAKAAEEASAEQNREAKDAGKNTGDDPGHRSAVHDARDKGQKENVASVPDDRARMEARAREIGIKGRLPKDDADLQQKIDDKLAEEHSGAADEDGGDA